MSKSEAFATKLPTDLKDQLDEVCERFGYRKNFIVEQALREKLEDILDAHDLEQAVKEASGFQDWQNVKKQMKASK